MVCSGLSSSWARVRGTAEKVNAMQANTHNRRRSLNGLGEDARVILWREELAIWADFRDVVLRRVSSTVFL